MRILLLTLALPLLGQQSVPFVGCKSEGMLGPQDAPTGKDPILAISAQVARRVAFYTAGGKGVLAPRGWFCFNIYGSSGGILFVSPEPINPERFFSQDSKGFTGEIIELAFTWGESSGRSEVAQAISRVFPSHKAFVTRVVEMFDFLADRMPSGPYPTDKLTYKSNEVVEFETPAQNEGLGTSFWLLKNDTAMSGVLMLIGESPDLVQLSVRLPPNLADLAPVIIQQVERDAAALPH